MHKLYGLSPFEIMPTALQTQENEALGYAVEQAIKRILDYTSGISLYADLEAVSDGVLNLMAQELRTQYYDAEAERKVREELVRNALPWHMHGGTRSVLEEYLATLYGGGRISEWYEYGGAPYYFKAIVAVDEDIEISLGDSYEIVKRIEAYKNIRSWLEALMFQMTFQYHVPIEYENRITLQTEFYPRYNLGFLALDGTWILDGSRRLNGYNSGSIIDFYPVSVRIPMEVSPQLKAGLQSRIQAECMIATDGNSDIEVVVDTEVDESTDIDRILIRAEVSAGIDYSAGVTRMNLLDGTWKLDGSRKLDGGREILSGIPDDGQFIPGRLVVVSRSITVSDGTLVSDETLYAELEDDGLRIYYNDDTEMKLEVIPIEK